jgi:hypothetical protein
MQQFTLKLTETQLKRLIKMAKKGTISKPDNELVEYLETFLKTEKIQLKTTYFPVEMNYDEIPF